jgi:ABC-type polysaccharide/polyol phosphate export permease
VNAVAELRSSRDLIVNLTLREIRGKYKRTVLGQAWSLVNPIAQMLTYSLVFGFFLRNDPGPGNPSNLNVFALWLSAGLLPWLFFSAVVNGGMGALTGNANLILKVYFPRGALVVSSMLANLFTHAIEMGVLFVAIVLFGGSPLLYLPATVYCMLLMATFGLGLGYMLSVANVYFRDTQHFVAIFLNLLFYLTPIVYPLRLVEKHAESHPLLVDMYRMNPIERFCEVFRNTLYDGRWPSLYDIVFLTAVSVLTMVIGRAIFDRFSGRLAEEL